VTFPWRRVELNPAWDVKRQNSVRYTHTHTIHTHTERERERERELNVKIKAFERNYILIPS
jgi:hypothetical protein